MRSNSWFCCSLFISSSSSFVSSLLLDQDILLIIDPVMSARALGMYIFWYMHVLDVHIWLPSDSNKHFKQKKTVTINKNNMVGHFDFLHKRCSYEKPRVTVNIISMQMIIWWLTLQSYVLFCQPLSQKCHLWLWLGFMYILYCFFCDYWLVSFSVLLIILSRWL